MQIVLSRKNVYLERGGRTRPQLLCFFLSLPISMVTAVTLDGQWRAPKLSPKHLFKYNF